MNLAYSEGHLKYIDRQEAEKAEIQVKRKYKNPVIKKWKN